uniref:Spaetzle domain-containing protein n=1 Tax=Anopheles atroparvus TaxID=41427 RepID=A0AAG5DVK8_ANOAO
MARFERCCVYLSLFALLVLIGSLSAIPQTFGPLIRDRSIRPQTSEEELNANIDHIYKKDFKTPAMAAASAKGPAADQQLELVTRANPVGQRVKKPIDSNDKKGIAAVVRDDNGKLQVVFFNSTTLTPPTTPPAQYEHVVSHAPTKHDEILVLRVAGVNGTSMEDMAGYDIAVGSYPADYPFEKIRRILKAKREMYSEVFEKAVAAEALVTRIDSPSDQYLCSSTRSYRYPTYHPEAKVNIVNMEGYFQQVTFEVCDNVGALCSNAIPASKGKLICEQVYGMYDVYTAPLDDSTQFVKTKLRFPSCCKCRHEAP